MVSLDLSVLPALIIFLCLVFLLNHLLFRPILRIQSERAERTTGIIAEARRKMEHQSDLLRRHEEAVKAGRKEGYRILEQARAGADQKRSESLELARSEADRLVQEARTAIREQVQEARGRLSLDARELARGIASAVLQRTA